MDYKTDQRIILTLDAGGTNFDFQAVRGGDPLNQGVRLPAAGLKLEDVLRTILTGFETILKEAPDRPEAISFCFPGPADYENGIIGDLANLPLFRGGVPLKAMLENHFGIPVFINNDGDLFAYGEGIAGLLPEVNRALKEAGSIKQYQNLLGVTFGTGFGGGLVSRGELFRGDNSAGLEINRMRNKIYGHTSAEDSISIRGVRRVFAREAGINMEGAPEPETIFRIGTGHIEGNKTAALKAFSEMGEVAGSTLADAVTLTDSLIVIGGGLAGAWPLFMPKLIEEMNASFTTITGEELSRLEIMAYNLEGETGRNKFLSDTAVKVKVPFSDKMVDYDPVKKIGVGITRLGTSRAVAVGAYAFALNELSNI